MIANNYSDEQERSISMSIILIGVAVGVLSKKLNLNYLINTVVLVGLSTNVLI